MAAVNTKEGIQYGLQLVRYLVILAIAATVLGVLSAGFIFLISVVDSTLLTLIFLLLSMASSVISFVVILGGLAGLSYKVIADGVSVGTRHAHRSASE